MAGWTRHNGHAVALNIDNIDTDQLIPARFMSVPRSEGYGDYLLYDMRRGQDGALNLDFALNQSSEASVLIAGRNFGTGSSREAAVYALVDAGFHVIIAPGFGDIFASNAVNNGLLPATLPNADIERLREVGDGAEVKVSLADMEIICGDATFAFALDETWRTKLRNGWDDIDLTLQHQDEIAKYRTERKKTAPWAWL